MAREEGKPWNGTLLGYRYRNGVIVIELDEAETVRRIFREFLSGKGVIVIAKGLNADGVKTRYGRDWGKTSIGGIRRNYAYTWNLLLQKTFRENHLTKKTVVKDGSSRCTMRRERTRPSSAWRNTKRCRPKLHGGPQSRLNGA